jgi:hypothetical protein
MILAIGLFLSVVGLVLLLDLGRSGAWVIRHLTSRNLGELAPGYAASRSGFRVYATLILAMGVAVSGLGLNASAPLTSAAAMIAGAVAFVIASIIAIAGEVRTYRALPRR